MNKHKNIKYDLISAINVLEYWEKFESWNYGPYPEDFIFGVSDVIQLINDTELEEIKKELTVADFSTLVKNSNIDFEENCWYEVIFKNGDPVQITKKFTALNEVKEYLLSRVDEFTDYIVKEKQNIDKLLPWEHKIFKVRESLCTKNPMYKELVQLLDGMIEADFEDMPEYVYSFIHTLYEQVKQRSIESNN